ncbi:MAG: hypothetical protein WDO13_10785 [Verrucomicrobiota bacterium]
MDAPAKKHGCLKTAGIGVLVVMVVLVLAVGVWIVWERAGAVDRGLAEASAQMNKSLPQYLDINTRLDSTSVGPGRVFHYHCTVLLWLPNQSVDYFVKTERAGLLDDMRKKASATAVFAQDGVTVEYDFTTQGGDGLAQIVFTPADLKQALAPQ